MLIVETIRKIRCAYHRDRKSIRQIAREYKLSRNTVRKVVRNEATEFTYDRKAAQPLPKLAPYQEMLTSYLDADASKPPKEQRTAIVLYEELQRQGFEGGYDSVRRYVQKWRNNEAGRRSRLIYHRVSTLEKHSSSTGAMSRLNWGTLLLR